MIYGEILIINEKNINLEIIYKINNNKKIFNWKIYGQD